ncbi:hypothetical protein LCGC14_2175750 [marine sediment metagenome]|uniref:TonB C-terminal domain-containing protein n=1 Tax=marine sediment metagenome TaxID=412755 RepID=A0A0F9DNP1_9ZZZZ|nr:energy transducer TonB [Methylophaga sp.]
MIKKQHWLIALLIACVLHAAAFISFASTDQIDQAEDTGKSGVEIDLGMLGDLGTATADPIVEEVVAEKEPEPEKEIEPPEVVEPTPVEPEPEPIPEPVKLDPKPVVQKNDVKIKKQVKAPKVEKKIIPKEKPTPIKPVEHKVAVAATKTAQKATSSTNTTREKKASTGTQNTLSSGAQKSAERSYFAELSAKLARHKRYPNRSRRLHEEGIVVLFIAINRDGTVTNSYISKSSGFPKLDEAVLSMLRKASPLPAFPDDMKQANLSINIPIDFKLNDRR